MRGGGGGEEREKGGEEMCMRGRGKKKRKRGRVVVGGGGGSSGGCGGGVVGDCGILAVNSVSLHGHYPELSYKQRTKSTPTWRIPFSLRSTDVECEY